MGQRRAAAERLRSAEFAAFAAGAAGRLLHAATLLTGDPAADALLCAALSRTYADWYRMRGEDPYAYTRADLVRRYAHRPWWHRPGDGVLARLTPQERLVVVLRLFEGVAEEQTAAQLGLPADRVRAICLRATATLRSRPTARGAVLAPPGQPQAR
ncbi:RNA polymerase [Streptomyces sp. NBC_01537]|uniref:sigma factor-like helix-turn-helix DNA-binding protein n=1 Tax=Streptomyces sp. NBC_01537 TaxID=2903896 RepID=UPI00386A867A